MTTLWSGLTRGVMAGAAGTTALNTTTYLDMAVRARPASDTPQQVVTALADRGGVDIPGRRKDRARRVDALGPLSGTATGVAIGGVAGVLRAGGLRLPGPIGGVALGAAAMLASDGPATLLRITDPRGWGTVDWVSDAVPHLVYGFTAHAAVAAAIPAEDAVAARPPARVLLRSAAIGAATGARSAAGIAAVSFTSSVADRGAVLSRWASSRGSTVAGLLAGTELVLDKLPSTPARTAAQGMVPRVALGATAAAAVARRDGHAGTLPGAVGLVSAVAAALAGVEIRAASARRFGSDLPGAVVEDVAAGLLGWLGARRRRQ